MALHPLTASEKVMEILEKLHQEHEEVKGLLAKMCDTEDARTRSELFSEFKTALVKHARAEEKALYDPIIKSEGKDAAMDAREGYVEHEVADKLVEKLSRARNKGSEEWTAGIMVLKEILEHHIEEEEDEMFSSAREQFDDGEREKMEEKFEKEKSKVKA
ncbi:MAG: hypothetical protein GEU92_02655 [Alphaproteobacteria bacterium]|nr:hypothetical protein [Alphaproteobacteria bacterium]